MKKFLRGILSIWIVLLLFVLGFVLSFKSIVIDTTDTLIKKEITNNLTATLKEYSENEMSEEAIDKIQDAIENNKSLQNLMESYYDKMIEILSENTNETIDITKDLKSIIDEGEEILKDYGITITEDEKEELLKAVAEEDVNTLVNDSIKELKETMPKEARNVLEIYKFLTSNNFNRFNTSSFTTNCYIAKKLLPMVI